MSWIQELEELEYDTESEYQNILRQEAYDPFADEYDPEWTWTEQDYELAERVGLGEFEEH